MKDLSLDISLSIFIDIEQKQTRCSEYFIIVYIGYTSRRGILSML